MLEEILARRAFEIGEILQPDRGIFDPIAFPASISSNEIFSCGVAGDDAIVPAQTMAKAIARALLENVWPTQPPLPCSLQELTPFYLKSCRIQHAYVPRLLKNHGCRGAGKCSHASLDAKRSLM